ncbi:MAG: flagellar motor switch protein FliM [Acidobacteria bacterium]|nr:flagellar motor switch protein FliM [Acidobacteriota bacterium]
MEKVLSQEEINALFSAMSSEDLGLAGQPEKTAVTRKIANYDFHRADRISQDQMRSIHLLHEHFGRNFASSLSAYLRSFVDVNLASLEQISYSSFIKSLPDPTLFASIGMRPMDSNIALELNPTLAFPMIDMILGGPGRALPENRNLTEIELNIIEGVIKLAMRDLCGAWHPIMDFEFYLEGKGTKAQMFQIVSPAETVIAVQMELRIAETTGMMNLCIPSRLLKLLRNKFDQQWNSRRQKTTGGEAERIFELIKPAPVSLSCEIRHSRLTVDDLLKVSDGDVVELSERINDPVYLCVGGIAKFLGRIVQRRGKRAFEIIDRYVG